jgi:hypothetical protein
MALFISCRSLRSYLLPLALLYSANQAAAAYTYYVAPAPIGNDKNNCSTPSRACTTFQRAVDLCPFGQHCNISAAPGVYSQRTNVFYYKVISIWGPLNNKGECANNRTVVVDDRIGTAKPGTIFFAQDHSILTIACMTLKAYAEGSLGFGARQFSIGDLNDISFGTFVAGSGLSATETSKINVYNPEIGGSASRFAAATDLSQVSIGGTIALADDLTFDVAFVSSIYNSVVSVYPLAITGGKALSGASYHCVDSIVKRNTSLPGGDIPYAANADCKVSGLASDREPISSEFNALRTEFADTLRSNQSQFSEKLQATRNELRAELNANQSQLADKLQATRNELRRNSIIVICAVLVITGIGSAIAWLQHRHQKHLEYIVFKGIGGKSVSSDTY